MVQTVRLGLHWSPIRYLFTDTPLTAVKSVTAQETKKQNKNKKRSKTRLKTVTAFPRRSRLLLVVGEGNETGHAGGLLNQVNMPTPRDFHICEDIINTSM